MNVHARYIIGMLAFALVVIASSSVGTNPNLTQILGFALSLASLILALIAIVHSLVSTSSAE